MISMQRAQKYKAEYGVLHLQKHPNSVKETAISIKSTNATFISNIVLMTRNTIRIWINIVSTPYTLQTTHKLKKGSAKKRTMCCTNKTVRAYLSSSTFNLCCCTCRRICTI